MTQVSLPDTGLSQAPLSKASLTRAPRFTCISTPRPHLKLVTHIVLAAERVEEIVGLAERSSVITTGLTLEDVTSPGDFIAHLTARNPAVANLPNLANLRA